VVSPHYRRSPRVHRLRPQSVGRTDAGQVSCGADAKEGKAKGLNWRGLKEQWQLRWWSYWGGCVNEKNGVSKKIRSEKEKSVKKGIEESSILWCYAMWLL
jgi:hypothetical protein